MSNRSTASAGVGALLVGVAMGAAAVYLSNEKNRQRVAKAVTDLTQSAVDLAKDIKENPEEVARRAKQSAKHLATSTSVAAKQAGVKVTEASKDATIKALDVTEKSAGAAKAKLADEPKTVAKTV